MPQLDNMTMILIGGGVVLGGLFGGLVLALVLRSMSWQNMKSLPPSSPGRTEPQPWKPAPLPPMSSGTGSSFSSGPSMSPSLPPQTSFSATGGTGGSQTLSAEASEQLMALLRAGRKEEAIMFLMSSGSMTREQAERTAQVMGFFARLSGS